MLLLLAVTGAAAGPQNEEEVLFPPTDVGSVMVEPLDGAGFAVQPSATQFQELKVTMSVPQELSTRVLSSQGKLFSVTFGSGFCLVIPQTGKTSAETLASHVTITTTPQGTTVNTMSGLNDQFCGFAGTWDHKLDPQTHQCSIPDPGGFCVLAWLGDDCTNPLEVPQVNAVISGEGDGTGGTGVPNPDDPSGGGNGPGGLSDCSEDHSDPCWIRCPGPNCPGDGGQCPGPNCPGGQCPGPYCPDTP